MLNNVGYKTEVKTPVLAGPNYLTSRTFDRYLEGFRSILRETKVVYSVHIYLERSTSTI